MLKSADCILETNVVEAASPVGCQLRLGYRQVDIRNENVSEVNLNDQVLSMYECLLPDPINSDIFFSLIMHANLWTFRGEPSEIRNLLVTLVANSCDFLPAGGRVTVETANLSLSDSGIFNGSAVLNAGEYVVLSISDTRTSAAAAVMNCLTKRWHNGRQPHSHATTRPASIYEVVRSSGGDIVLQNEQGNGSTVQLFFPRYEKLALSEHTLASCEPSPVRHPC